MHELYGMKKLLVSFIGLSLIALLLTGCLVENTDPPPLINRTTDNLRIINPGDRLVYYIEGTRTVDFSANTGFTGQMTVEWFSDNIENPNLSGTQPVPVLREVTTISYYGGGGTTMVRYITQDPLTGSISVHGYYNQPNNLYVGIYPSSQPYSYEPVEVVPSPLGSTNFGSSLRVMTCSNTTNTCADVRPISEAVEYQGDYPTVIRAGKYYNTLYYTYTGILPDGNSIPLPEATPLDFRMSCDPNAFAFNGEYYYFPEVGLVAFLSSCSGFVNGSRIDYLTFGSLQSASFPLP